MTGFSKYELPSLPFASDYFGRDGWRGSDDKTMPTMFTKANCVPASMGGKPITRDMMNKLGYLATIGSYLDRIGYPYGNEPIDWSEFGGYPKGAVVRIFDEENHVTREFLSLVDNNTNTDPWSTVPSATVISEDSGNFTTTFWDNHAYWRPLFRMKEYSYFPDYTNRVELINESVYDGHTELTIPYQDSGWIYITRVIPNFDTISRDKMFNNPNGMSVSVILKAGTDTRQQYEITRIMPYEGMNATRIIPFKEELPDSGEIIARVENRYGASTDEGDSIGPIQVIVERLEFED